MAVETLTVLMGTTEHPLPVLALKDRRGRKPHRSKQWTLVRAVEKVLYDLTDGQRSIGSFANFLSKHTMREAVLVCEKACIAEHLLTEDELDAGDALPPPHRSPPQRLMMPPLHRFPQCSRR